MLARKVGLAAMLALISMVKIGICDRNEKSLNKVEFPTENSSPLVLGSVFVKDESGNAQYGVTIDAHFQMVVDRLVFALFQYPFRYVESPLHSGSDIGLSFHLRPQIAKDSIV